MLNWFPQILNMKRKLLLLIILPFINFAQIPSYYSSIDFSLTGNSLKAELANLITTTHTTKLPYTSSSMDTWDAIQLSDLDPNNSANLNLLYGFNDFNVATNDDRTRDKTLTGNSSCIGYWNREHTFPKSLASPTMDTNIPGVSTDIHHLRAADCQWNSTRNNRPFTDGQGDAKTVGSTDWYPGDEWKGDVARMMMYLYVRYNSETPATNVGVGSTSYSPFNDMPNIFLEWNTEDPVSINEINRNEAVYSIQGNRNPFIDNPYLATLIWGGPQAPDFWNTLTCTNTTTWNGSSWNNGIPNKETLAIVNGNLTLTSDLEMCSLDVSSGVAVLVPSGFNLTVVRSINVNASSTLTVENNANLIQINNISNTGNIIVNKNSSPLVRLDYTSWSSPVSGQNLKAFSPNTLDNRFYEYVSAGTIPTTAYANIDPLTNDFQPGKAYIIRAPNNWLTSPTVYNGQFVGTANNGQYEQNINLGFNMIGNPYPSTITADEFIANNRTIETLYFWTHTAPASGGSYPVNNFASYTTMGGVASAAGGEIPDGTVKPGQGFYVYSSDNEKVLFHNGQRVKVSNSQFFRMNEFDTNNVIVEKHRIWLNLSSNENHFNQMLVGYSNFATSGFDLAFDGKTMDKSITHLYNIIDNEDCVIQARPMPFDDSDVVDLGIKVNNPGTYYISLENKDGLFETKENIFIKDNYTGAIHNVTQSPYMFVSNEGNFTNRFKLMYKEFEPVQIDENTVLAYGRYGNLVVTSSNEKIKHIIVFDLLGRNLLSETNLQTYDFETNVLMSNNQPILVKIILANGQVILKKVIL